MGFGIGSMIPASKGLTIVKIALEKTLKQKFERFDLIYKHEEKTIDFRLYNFKNENGEIEEKAIRKYADGEKLCGFIAAELKNRVASTDKVKFAVASYPENKCVYAYETEDGRKIRKEFSLT